MGCGCLALLAQGLLGFLLGGNWILRGMGATTLLGFFAWGLLAWLSCGNSAVAAWVIAWGLLRGNLSTSWHGCHDSYVTLVMLA